jgi:uncharacterized damage-inducible protein DinB
MERAALLDLLDYTDFTWASYERVLTSLPDDALTRPIDTAGRQTLGHGLFHLAAAWSEWFEEHAPAHITFPATDDEACRRELSSILAWRGATRAVMRHLLETASDDELRTPSQELWPDAEGKPRFRASAADVLEHVLLHERGHHGDIATIFTVLGAELPPSDYLVYLFFKRRS